VATSRNLQVNTAPSQTQQQLAAFLARLTEIAFRYPITNHSLIQRLPLARSLQQLAFQLVQ
jgi:hypothetical protein